MIPQITAVYGACGGGLAVVPALSDFSFIESENGKVFVNAPNTLEGNRADKLDTSAPEYQAKTTGNIDGIGSEAEIASAIRELVGILPGNNGMGGLTEECLDDLNRACESMESMRKDAHYVIAEIADDHIFVETKKEFAKSMTTGFIRLNGQTIGVCANNMELRDEEGNVVGTRDNVICHNGALKAAEFASFCDAFDIPLLTITNVKGFMATVDAEARIAKSVAKMTYTFANATVPKVSLITGEAYGSAYACFNSKSTGADLVYAWPTAKFGAMESGMAAKILYAGEDAAALKEHAAEYEKLQGSVTAAAARGLVDRIVEPADTRKYLIAAFEMLYTKSVSEVVKKHGTK